MVKGKKVAEVEKVENKVLTEWKEPQQVAEVAWVK